MTHKHTYKLKHPEDVYKICPCGKRRKAVTKPKKSKLRKECDAAWSRVTKLISELKFGKKCLWCGKSDKLQSDHIINRWKTATRWNPDNCVVLCATCHLFKKKREPYRWYEVMRAHVKPETYEALSLASNEIVKNPDYAGILYGLCALEKEVQEKLDLKRSGNVA